MQSKTSFFNKTIYKKNLTRFAPVWSVYTLCLVLGVLLVYSNGGTLKQFHFANNYMYDMFAVLAVVNLGYALLVAQLLFGDLYSSRMCNMLHAFPIGRESWFLTNVASAMTFSVVPTAVMAVVSAPLLMGSMFDNAVTLAFWAFLAANLEFICCFGIAAFAAMCTANRFTMAAGYGLMHAGALIVYWLVDTVYRPMLYGVITPTQLAYNLTPMYHMSDRNFVTTEFGGLYELREKYGEKLDGVRLQFALTEEWWHLWLVAGVGVVFILLALVLYKKRQLECAGDAVAFRWLVPVFEVLCAVCVTTAASFFLENFLYITELRMVTLTIGLVVGWFVAKMLVEHTTRVFRLKNFYGLGILAAVFALSLGLTHFDVLGIEDYRPEAAKVRTVTFESDWGRGRKLESPADIEAMLKLHAGALEARAESEGGHVRGYDGSWVKYIDSNDHLYDVVLPDSRMLPGDQCTHAAVINLTYELENGKVIKRRYNVFVDTEPGRIANQYLNSWEMLDFMTPLPEGGEVKRSELALETFRYVNINYMDEDKLPQICFEKDAALELLSCMDLDLQEGHMAAHPYFHSGVFQREEEKDEVDGHVESESRTVTFYGKKYTWSIDIYPDARHTIKWLNDHDLMDWEVLEDQKLLW